MFLTDSIVSKSEVIPAAVYQEGCLLPVLRGKDVLSNGRYQLLLRQLRELADIDDTYFADLYETLIISFIEFVQALPAQVNGPLFSLLNSSLIRALSAMQHFIAHNTGRQAKPIYRYAVFSAALLLDVSKVVTQQKVMITDEQGSYIADWLPYLGASLPTEGEYYKFYFYTTPYSRLDISLTVLLAKQIMPPSGFEWISSDFEVFADWLDALQGNASSGGRIATTLSHIKLEDLDKLMRSLGHLPIDVVDSTANEYGEKFIKWFKQSIEDGTIKVNERDSGVHIVDGEYGLFIGEKVIKRFCDLMNVPVNFYIVLVQLGNSLGIPSKGAGDYLHAQLFSDSPSVKQSKLGFSAEKSALKEQGMCVQTNMILKGLHQVNSRFKLADSHLTSSLPKSSVTNHTNYTRTE